MWPERLEKCRDLFGRLAAGAFVDRRSDVDSIGAECAGGPRVVRPDATGEQALAEVPDGPRSALQSKVRPVPPSPLSNSSRSPPRPAIGSRPTLTRRPDFAAARQRAPERGDIVRVLRSVQLDRVEVSGGGGLDDRLRQAHCGTRRPATCRAASGSGQRRRFVDRDLAGAARHEHEARECRWPCGAKGGAAIQSAQFGASEH